MDKRIERQKSGKGGEQMRVATERSKTGSRFRRRRTTSTTATAAPSAATRMGAISLQPILFVCIGANNVGSKGIVVQKQWRAALSGLLSLSVMKKERKKKRVFCVFCVCPEAA